MVENEMVVGLRGYVDERRLGRFTIDHQMIRSATRIVGLLLGRMIVVRAESLFHANAIEYVAYSPLFDPVPEGEVVPEYVIICENEASGISSVRAERR